MRFPKLIFALLTLFLVAGLQPALAGKQDFVLHNATGVDIYAIYVSPTGVEEWQEDILAVDVLMDGESLKIKFNRGETAQLWDIRVEDEEGNALMWEGINLLEASEVTLLPDGTAELE